MKETLNKYISQIEEILIKFNISENDAQAMLSNFLEQLKKEDADNESVFGACVYNVLATINSVPCHTKKSAQLINALVEAKEEMTVICEIL